MKKKRNSGAKLPQVPNVGGAGSVPGAGAGAGKPGMTPGPLTAEEKATRKAKREANKKSQLSYQTILANVAAESGQPPAIVNVVSSTLKAVIGKALLGDSVVMLGPDLGSFKVMSTEARKGRNPRTGETIDVPAGKRVRFQPGSALKTLLLTGQVPTKPTRPAPKSPDSAPVSPAPVSAPVPPGTPELPVGKPGQSERARKIAAKKALRATEGQVSPAAPPVQPETGEDPPESSVSDADIDSILNESLDGEGEGDAF